MPNLRGGENCADLPKRPLTSLDYPFVVAGRLGGLWVMVVRARPVAAFLCGLGLLSVGGPLATANEVMPQRDGTFHALTQGPTRQAALAAARAEAEKTCDKTTKSHRVVTLRHETAYPTPSSSASNVDSRDVAVELHFACQP